MGGVAMSHHKQWAHWSNLKCEGVSNDYGAIGKGKGNGDSNFYHLRGGMGLSLSIWNASFCKGKQRGQGQGFGYPVGFPRPYSKICSGDESGWGGGLCHSFPWDEDQE
jgi:hypothetical protein